MKIKFITLFMCILFIGTVSAWDWDNTLSPQEKNLEGYEILKIKNALGLGSTLAEYELTYNMDMCLINCESRGIVKLYVEDSIFDSFDFKNREGTLVNIPFEIYIKVNESYQLTVNDYGKEVCSMELTANGTMEICERELLGNHIQTNPRYIYKLYQGEILSEGIYEWKMLGKKDKGEAVDWGFSTMGISTDEIREFFAWWDTSWSNKKKITITENAGANIENYTIDLAIDKIAGMTAGLGDIRFLNETENAEYGYYIYSENATSFGVRVNYGDALIPKSSSNIMYMYYNNPSATTTSSITAAHLIGEDGKDFSEWTELDSGSDINLNTVSERAEFIMNRDGETGAVYRDIPVALRPIENISIEYLMNVSSSTGQAVLTGASNGTASKWLGSLTMNTSNLDTAPLGVASHMEKNHSYTYVMTNAGGNVSLTMWNDTAKTKILNQTNMLEPNFLKYTNVAFEQIIMILGTKDNGAASQVAVGWITNLTVSKFITPLPSYVVGAQESLGAQVTLNNPIDHFNSTSKDVLFNCTATFVSDPILNITLIINDIANETITNSTEDSNVSLQLTKSLSDGSYTWNCEGCDDSGTCNNASTSFNVNVDANIPAVTINLPTPLINNGLENKSEELNWSIIEVNLDSIWFDYNGTNITVFGLVNETTFTLESSDNTNLTFYVNDTSGSINQTFVDWDYRVFELSNTFNKNTTEGNLESFSAKAILGSGLSIVATSLIYNGTSNVGSNSIFGGITTLSVSNVLVPSVDINSNVSFFWSLLLSDTAQVNLSIQNQTVFNLGVDNCTTFTKEIFNFTSVDEEKQTVLGNATKEIAINFFSADRSQVIFNISNTFFGNTTLICLNNNLTGSSSYSVDAIIKYTAPNYAIEYFNIVDFTLTNNTPLESIILYSLNITDSTDFRFTFTGEDFLPVEDALVLIERQYIADNNFKTVELPKTDANGQTVLHLVRNDIIYNIIIMKDGEVLGRFENLIAFCDDFTIGDCQIALNAIAEASAPNFDEELGITFNGPPSYNDTTKIVSFDFISVDGTSKIIIMNVERRDVFGNTSVCSNTLFSTSGTLFCNTGNISDTNLVTSISIDGEIGIISNTQIATTPAFGTIGYVFLFFLSLMLMLIFGDSKNGVMVAVLIGYIASVALGWVVGGIVGAGSGGIMLIITTITAIWQINRNRST